MPSSGQEVGAHLGGAALHGPRLRCGFECSHDAAHSVECGLHKGVGATDSLLANVAINVNVRAVGRCGHIWCHQPHIDSICECGGSLACAVAAQARCGCVDGGICACGTTCEAMGDDPWACTGGVPAFLLILF